MKTVNVFAVYGFPLWYAEGGVYLTEKAREVPTSEWLDGQIQAGVVALAEAAQAVSAEESKPARRRKVEA